MPLTAKSLIIKIEKIREKAEKKVEALITKEFDKLIKKISIDLHKLHKIKENKIHICSGMGYTTIWVYSPRHKKVFLLDEFFKMYELTGHKLPAVYNTLQEIQLLLDWEWTYVAPYKFWLNSDGITIEAE